MEWEGDDLARLLAWLEDAAAGPYARERRLDPFATSMRDFDDVSEDLRHLGNGLEPARNDPGQRIVDLRAAELATRNPAGLSPLGQYTLDGWTRHGVANRERGNELARHVILVAEASRARIPRYELFFDYWSELRERYTPGDLINNWDALYVLNYLDFPRNGYCPGDRYHEGSELIEEIEFDLDEVAGREGGSAEAIAGANRLRRAIEFKVPRGRHRATFCCALEIMTGGRASLEYVIGHFGVPRGPRAWANWNEAAITTIRDIAEEYGLLEWTDEETRTEGSEPATEEGDDLNPIQVEAGGDDTVEEDDEHQLELPENINYEIALVDLPPPSADQQTPRARRPSGQGFKTDHIKQAVTNKEVGDLGEKFALRYEEWRLRKRPDLKERMRHISKEDDSAGYDILSFEEDGSSRFVEVKSTTGALKTPFFLSARELEIAEEKREEYVILRVFDLRNSPKCCEIRFPFDGVLQLSPASYIVTFV